MFLDVAFDEAAEFIRRFLRHTALRTQAQRMGSVVRVHHSGVGYWQARFKRRMLSGGDSVASVGWKKGHSTLSRLKWIWFCWTRRACVLAR